MTREEASEKVAKAYINGPDTGLSFVNALEALGLLKFEEPKKQYDTRTVVFSSQNPCAYQAIAQLEDLGYTVTLNDKGKV